MCVSPSLAGCLCAALYLPLSCDCRATVENWLCFWGSQFPVPHQYEITVYWQFLGKCPQKKYSGQLSNSCNNQTTERSVSANVDHGWLAIRGHICALQSISSRKIGLGVSKSSIDDLSLNSEVPITDTSSIQNCIPVWFKYIFVDGWPVKVRLKEGWQ